MEISKQFKNTQNPQVASETLIKVCKYYRIIPNELGYVFYDVLQYPCKLCGQRRVHKCKLRKLKCNHIFHDRCIKNWLIENQMQCFVCKSTPFNTN
jgi:hypothetical protein